MRRDIIFATKVHYFVISDKSVAILPGVIYNNCTVLMIIEEERTKHMKRILSIALSILMLIGAVSITGISVSAAEPISFDYADSNKGGTNGFVDKKTCGTLEVVEEDGRKALKFTPDLTSENAGAALAIEGYGLAKYGAAYDTYRYASIEYKYVSTAPKAVAFAVQLCNSNKVFESGGMTVAADETLKTGEWTTAYFDMTAVDTKLATALDAHPINHIQLRPFGGTKVNALDAGDVIYIGKLTFSETNLKPGGTTVEAKPVEKTEAKASPATTVTPEALGGPNTESLPKVVGADDVMVELSSLTGSFVDKKDSGTLEKVTVDGRPALKYTPNPDSPDKNATVSIETSGLSTKLPSKVTYEEYSYISLEYFYAPSEEPLSTEILIYLANSNKIFEKPDGKNNVKSAKLVSGKWATAYFDITPAKANLKADLEEHVLNHIHVRPFNTTSSKLRTTDVIYLGKIGFHKADPNPKTEYEVSYIKSISGAVGEDIAKSTVDAGAEVTLAECPWTVEGFEFVGWEVNGETKKPGDVIIAEGSNDLTIGAVWKEAADKSNSKGFNYATGIFSEICEKKTNATAETVQVNGIDTILAKPVPTDEKPGMLILDAFSLKNKIKVDLDVYKYVTLVYRQDIVTENEKITAPHVQFTRNSGMFKNGVPLKRLDNTVRNGEWCATAYEIPDLTENYTDPSGVHSLAQVHVYPFGNKIQTNELSAGDAVYVQGMIFSKEKPDDVKYAPAYITGYSDGTFGPNKTMTRAQACTVVARLLAGSDEKVTAADSTSFSDVDSSAWYYKYVSYCEAKGLLKSYSGKYEPNGNITRAEFAELVYNMGIVSAGAEKKTFTDVGESHPRYEAIMAAASAGLVTGYADGTFLPDRTITRAQVVTVINNAYGRHTLAKRYNEYGGMFSDVDESSWAAGAIVDSAVSHVALKNPGVDEYEWIYREAVSSEVTEAVLAEGKKKLEEVNALEEKRIAEIRATETKVTVTGTKYYFANDGDDANDGLSEAKPKKTIGELNKLSLKPGDGVYFKRGDTFRGGIIGRSGVTYTAYGTGDKPKLYASPANFAGADNWELTSTPNVWKLKTPIKNDVGLVVFDEGKAWTEKFIKGAKGFTGDLSQINVDLGMWHDVSAPTNVEGYLYVRSDKGNPGSLYTSIEVNPREHILKASDGIVVDNLCFKYGGAHGISAGNINGLTVQNCEFGWIGGSWFRTDTFSRYGNAVEVYGGCDGYTVNNCYIYQIYDAGVTHQYTEGGNIDIEMKNIKYTNNVITDTIYTVEYFIHKPDAGKVHRMVNVDISGNLFMRSGYGWGADPSRSAHIKGWNTYNEAENFTISNNTFCLSKANMIMVGAQVTAWEPKTSGNTYIQNFDSQFGNIGANSTKFIGTMEAYLKSAGDGDAKVYFLPALEK